MDLERVEGEIREIVESLDKGTRLEAVIEEKGEVRVFLSKGLHSDWVTFSKEFWEEWDKKGKTGKIVKKAIGKVISKLNLMTQKRR